MPQFQLLRCAVSLGGDKDNIVHRGRDRPVLFPELLLLQHLHGEDAINDIAVVGVCDMTNDEALVRLDTIYQPDIVRQVFPGSKPRLPNADGTLEICTRPIFKAKPVVPDNPDPKLRPLDQYTLNVPDSQVRVAEPAIEEIPSDAEIAANAQNGDENEDEDLGLGPDPLSAQHAPPQQLPLSMRAQQIPLSTRAKGSRGAPVADAMMPRVQRSRAVPGA